MSTAQGRPDASGSSGTSGVNASSCTSTGNVGSAKSICGERVFAAEGGAGQARQARGGPGVVAVRQVVRRLDRPFQHPRHGGPSPAWARMAKKVLGSRVPLPG